MLCALCVADDTRPLDVPGGRVPGGRSASCFVHPSCTLPTASAVVQRLQSRCVLSLACAAAPILWYNTDMHCTRILKGLLASHVLMLDRNRLHYVEYLCVRFYYCTTCGEQT